MSATSEQLLDAVLALPEDERLEFAEALAASLLPTDRPPFSEVIRRRSAELKGGRWPACPGKR
jgi:hypothetical protein